jgi:NADPH-dependent 2,4-dienoyl-CoA reductase/sulfur reductase-like enzyme
VKGYKYVILGGGVVAGYAAKAFVEHGVAAGDLGIISADDQLPYERPPLSKAFLAGKVDGEEILINDPDFYRHHNIGVRLESWVDEVDLAEKKLLTRDDDAIGFEKLLIATGSRVRKLDLPGADLDGLFYLRGMDDARLIRQAARDAERAVVIGGGFIGMEVASQLAQKGIETTMVFPEERLMAGFFTPEMSTFFQRYYLDRGVTFVTGAEITVLAGETALSSVELASGQSLPADMVVAGIGVEPAVELFQDTELALDHGVLVNRFLETNVPDVYAAGDVTNYRDVIFDKRRHIEHWDNAMRQGRHAALVMCGQREPYERIPYFFSDEFDLSWEFWGDTEEADGVVHRGDLDAGSFSTWWMKGERVVAAFVMDRPDEERDLAPEWIKSGRCISSDDLADAARPLE